MLPLYTRTTTHVTLLTSSIDIDIVELQEGSHYNKALELYNPLGVVVTLDGWRWGISFNGISTHDSDNISFAKGAYERVDV